MNNDRIDFNKALAVEMFGRIRLSASVGTLGVFIMAYPHLGTKPFKLVAVWSITMLGLLIWRYVFARNSLAAIADGKPFDGRQRLEVLHCALVGTGWGASLYAFDTSAMDQNFYLRLMVLAGALAFIVSSTAVVYQNFVAYSHPLCLVTCWFIYTHDYVQPRLTFLMVVLAYFLMLITLAISTRSSLRRAILDNQRVKYLSQDLNEALTAEKTLRDKMSQIARIDELTGILNRRGVLDVLAVEEAKSRRHDWPLSILMADIDHFKLVNDNHGHACGDAVLRAVVAAAKMELRDTDVFGRLGGDEILAVLPALSSDSALATAERLCTCIQRLAIPFDEKSIHVTLSIGVATFRASENSTQLLARADAALYQAKNNGRNRAERQL